ncbi:MAG: hypothetical protein AB7E60_11365 [Sphingobium sp.]
MAWQAIAAGFAVLLALAALLLIRRRRRPAADERALPVTADATPAPNRPKPAPQPTPVPATPPVPTPPDQSGDRPWIDIDITIEGARFSLMGLTIGYALTLSNRGAAEAVDIMVHAFIGPAEGDQQAALRHFFSGQDGSTVHSVVSIAPGQSHRLTGELRLAHDAINPMRQDERSLFVPLVAFDAHYGWDGRAGGRTGRAFVIGQERQPPADRLSPFRLDLGPRQFRDPASRATALMIQR